MRQFYPDEDMTYLNAAPWQIDLLKKNPSYTSWGCFEDYMSDENGGWAKPVITADWKEHSWALDELNELVHFYFELYRENHECPHCEGSGLNKATKQLYDDWYDFAGTGRRWSDKITDVEVLALAKAGRLFNYTKDNFHFDDEKNCWVMWNSRKRTELTEMPELPTAETINQAQHGRGFGHDAINHWVCVKARAEHLGVYGNCEHCESGRIYDEEKGRVALQLWYLHPRKGCSRGVYIKNVSEEDVPAVIAYLKEARDRNNERFSKL